MDTSSPTPGLSGRPPKIVHDDIRVEQDHDRGRFDLWRNVDGSTQFIGFVGYSVEEASDASGKISPVYRLQHTIIDEQHSRKGYARALVTIILDQLRAEGARIDPECTYIQDYLTRYPEYQELVV